MKSRLPFLVGGYTMACVDTNGLRRLALAAGLLGGLAALPVGAHEMPAATSGRSTYEEWIARAIAADPEVSAAQLRWQAAAAEQPIAARWADPRASLEIMNPLTLAGPQLTVSQAISLPERYRTQTDLASADARVAVADLDARIADRRDAAIHALAERAYLQEALAVMTRAAARDRETVSLATARYAVGKIPQSDLLEAQLRETMARHDLYGLQGEAAAADATLQDLGILQPAPPPLPAVRRTSRTLPELLAIAETRSPALEKGRAELARAAVEVRSMEIMAHDPDFDVSVLAGRSMDRQMPYLGGSVGMTLPFVQHGAHHVHAEEARDRLEAARQGLDQARRDVRARIARALAQMTATESEIALHHRVLEAQAELAVRAAHAAFGAGQEPLSAVLARDADLDEIGRGGARLLADHEEAAGDLEAALGVPLQEIR